MSASNKNPNRPYTSSQKEERDQHGDNRSSQNQHNNPTHKTDQASRVENIPHKDTIENKEEE